MSPEFLPANSIQLSLPPRLNKLLNGRSLSKLEAGASTWLCNHDPPFHLEGTLSSGHGLCDAVRIHLHATQFQY